MEQNKGGCEIEGEQRRERKKREGLERRRTERGKQIDCGCGRMLLLWLVGYLLRDQAFLVILLLFHLSITAEWTDWSEGREAVSSPRRSPPEEERQSDHHV